MAAAGPVIAWAFWPAPIGVLWRKSLHVDAAVAGIVRLNERPTLRAENEQGGGQRVGDRSLWTHNHGTAQAANGFSRAWIQHMTQFIAAFGEGLAPDCGDREGFVVEFERMCDRWLARRCDRARRLGH